MGDRFLTSADRESNHFGDLSVVNIATSSALADIFAGSTDNVTLPPRALEAMANLIRSQTQGSTTTAAADAVGDRIILANECTVVGQLDLAPSTQALLDKHFSFVDVSLSDRIAYKVRRDVVPRELVEALDNLISDTHCQTLRSTRSVSSKVKEYDQPLSDGYLGTCVMGVQGSQGKDEPRMGKFLSDQEMHFSERLNSIISLKLNLLLRGENPLEGGRELRDSCGVMYTKDGRLHCWSNPLHTPAAFHRLSANDKLLALGTPN